MEAPVTISVQVWLDRDPDIDTGGLPTYLALAALWEAIAILDPEPSFNPDDESAE